MLNIITHSNYKSNLTNYKNNQLNEILLDIKNGNINSKSIQNAFYLYLNYMRSKNINDDIILKIGFINIFFERVFWINNSDWEPILHFSFFTINYLGCNHKDIIKMIDYIKNKSKKYNIHENIFYIEKYNYRKIIYQNILQLFIQTQKGGRSIQYTAEEKVKINKNISSINILHNFVGKKNNTPNRMKKRDMIQIFKQIILDKIDSTNIFYLNSQYLSRIKDKNNVVNIESNFIKYLKNSNKIYDSINVYMIKDYLDEILYFLNILIDNEDNIIYINDAQGLSHIRKTLEKMNINNYKKNNLTQVYTIFDYIINTYKQINKNTLGMIIDSASTEISISNYIPIYNNLFYNQILKSFFIDFSELNNRISFDFGEIFTNKKIILNILNIDNIQIEHKFTLKVFNTINFIRSIIKSIIHLDKRTKNENNEIKKIFKLNMDDYNEYIKLIYNLYQLFSNEKINNQGILYNKIKNYNTHSIIINKIISFILKFKLLGDQLQAYEANSNYASITNKKRILTTQDRILCGYCLIHNENYFISKIKLDDEIYLLYNA